MGFLTELRKGVSIKPKILTEALESLKVPNSGLKAFDDSFKSLDFKIENNILKTNGVPLSSIERLIRRGELIDAFNLMKKSTTITAVDELKFQNLHQTPDLKVKQLEDKIKFAKEYNSNLNIEPAADIEKNLDASTKKKMTTYWEKVKKTALVGGTAVGLFAAIIIGTNVYSSLVAATKARNGLYIVIRINNENKSYKISSKSCSSPELGKSTAYSGDAIKQDNIAVYLFYIISVNDTTQLEKINRLIGVTPNISNVKAILSNTEYTNKISEYYYSTSFNGVKLINSPCDVISSQSILTKPSCATWNPSASSASFEYYDTSELPENMTLVCVTNSTILDTIIDATGDAFNSVFQSSLSTNFSKYFKYVLIFIAVVFAFSIVFFFKNKLFPTKS